MGTKTLFQRRLNTVTKLLNNEWLTAENIIDAVFQWHAYMFIRIVSPIKNKESYDIIWVDDLSPVVSLIGLIPATWSRSKAAKLARFGQDAYTKDHIFKNAMKRLKNIEEATKNPIEEWIVNLEGEECGIVKLALPFLLAACAINGAFSGTPPNEDSQISSNLIRLAAISQLKFKQLPPTAQECKNQLQALSWNSTAERSNVKLDREKELMVAARRVVGQNRIRSAAIFDEFREGFCHWILRIHGVHETDRLLSEYYRLASAGDSVDFIRNAVIREVFRQVIVSGYISVEQGIEFIQQAFTSVDPNEILKSWGDFKAMNQLKSEIASIVSRWGLTDGIK